MIPRLKVFAPLIPTDFSAFHAHEILKTFEIRSFFCENTRFCTYTDFLINGLNGWPSPL